MSYALRGSIKQREQRMIYDMMISIAYVARQLDGTDGRTVATPTTDEGQSEQSR